MASVYEKAGKWYLRWKGPDGRWRDQVSTVRSKTEARRLAAELERHPIDEVEKRSEPKRAYVTLRADDVPLLLAAAPDAWRAVFTAALYTGLRKGELFGLLKSDVDLDYRTITVRRSYDRETTKGGHRRDPDLRGARPLPPRSDRELDERARVPWPRRPHALSGSRPAEGAAHRPRARRLGGLLGPQLPPLQAPRRAPQ
jgi:integrase